MRLVADLVAIALIGVLAVRGFWAGWFVSGLRLLGMAWCFFPFFLLWRAAGRCVHSVFGMPPLAAYALGGVLVLLLAYGVYAAIAHLIRRRVRRKETLSGKPLIRTRADKRLGAVLGGCAGVLLTSALVFAYGLARMAPFGAGWPDIHDSAAGRVAALVIQPAVYLFARAAAVNPQLSRIVARSAVNPRGAEQDMRSIARNPDVAALAQDKRFTDAVLRADERAMKGDARLKRLARDPEFIRSARELGLLRPQSASSDVEAETADLLARVGRNAARIRNDPEVRSILDDPAIQTMAAERDYGKLLRDERVLKLAMRVMQLVNSGAP